MVRWMGTLPGAADSDFLQAAPGVDRQPAQTNDAGTPSGVQRSHDHDHNLATALAAPSRSSRGTVSDSPTVSP